MRAAVSGCQVDPKRLIALKTPIEVIKRLGSIMDNASGGGQKRWRTEEVQRGRVGCVCFQGACFQERFHCVF